MTYSVVFSKQALKKLEKINEPYYSKIKTAISKLSNTPRPVGCKKLKGRSGFRIRIADYRVIYEIIDSQLIVDVIDLGHRKDIY